MYNEELSKQKLKINFELLIKISIITNYFKKILTSITNGFLTLCFMNETISQMDFKTILILIILLQEIALSTILKSQITISG